VAGNFAKNEVIRWFDYEIHGSLKNAADIDKNGLFIGNHHYPLDKEFALLQQALDEAAASGAKS
jgi:CDP-6-deoxy-D-xylo-4-hexulose-3-dehydrase